MIRTDAANEACSVTGIGSWAAISAGAGPLRVCVLPCLAVHAYCASCICARLAANARLTLCGSKPCAVRSSGTGSAGGAGCSFKCCAVGVGAAWDAHGTGDGPASALAVCAGWALGGPGNVCLTVIPCRAFQFCDRVEGTVIA